MLSNKKALRCSMSYLQVVQQGITASIAPLRIDQATDTVVALPIVAISSCCMSSGAKDASCRRESNEASNITYTVCTRQL